MIHALSESFEFSVLTTAVDPALPRHEVVEGVPVSRLFVDVRRPSTKLAAAWRTIQFFLTRSVTFDIVHLHGFSQKSVLIALLSRLFGKKLVITIHTADQDEPAAVRRLGSVAYWCYSQADRFIAISELMGRNYRASGLPADRLRVAPNGVDTERFRPVDDRDRAALRQSLAGLPAAIPWFLCVGFFSRDKRPDILYSAWSQLRARGAGDSALIFVGATESKYFEIDRGLMASIQQDAQAKGLAHLVHFAGEVQDVERWYQAADVYAMPSVREAFGMALVEAMATALPVVATRIDGVTDTIVEDGRTGLLVPPDDAVALADALRTLAAQPRPSPMGAAARRAVEDRYAIPPSRERWRQIYAELAS
jgi:glycosyltransferase involved in cell wall biosynthesis